MNPIDPEIFRAYDIRGRANEQLTQEACELIGKGFGSTLRDHYKIDRPRVAVGRDARTHSPLFEEAMVWGLKETGCHVLRIGQTPSPVNYFTICDQQLDAGVQITASHNPGHDNGVKLQVHDAAAYAGEDLQTLRKRIDVEEFVAGAGSEEEIDAVTAYLDHLEAMFGPIGSDMHVVIDGGNGVAGPVYSEALSRVRADVTGLYIEPDGTFPNHPADPSKHETLKELQQRTIDGSAQIGLAFDGDGDRLGIVDEEGTIRTADEILLLLAQDHLSRNPGKPVIFTVSNSGTLQTEIAKWGGVPVMCRVGHSFVEHAMREHRALLGGEQSGHFFCGEDYYGFDDALVAALRVLKILSESGQPLSQLFAAYPKVYQAPERRPYCPDSEKTRIVRSAAEHFAKEYPVETMDGARIDFGEGAWAGIRQSNTAPCLSICIEARGPEKLKEVEAIVLEHMGTYPEVDVAVGLALKPIAKG